jgi:hypothetical protein
MSEQSERPKDRVIIERVMNEWRRGCVVLEGTVPTVLSLLVRLLTIHGDKVTVDVVCDALGDLEEVAKLLQENLKEEKTKS